MFLIRTSSNTYIHEQVIKVDFFSATIGLLSVESNTVFVWPMIYVWWAYGLCVVGKWSLSGGLMVYVWWASDLCLVSL